VLVHGTGATAGRWSPVLPAFETRFSVYALDRRGRGDSGDAPTYAMEREFDDVVSVVESVGNPVNLVGHSYGGICALEAALLTTKVRRLVLYEPPIPVVDTPIYKPGVVDRIESFAAQGDREEIVKTFMLEVLQMPLTEFTAFRNSPAWPDRLATAQTLPRELRAHERYSFDARRFQQLAVPTLLLVGGDSPAFFRMGTELLHGTLPQSRVVVLPGQRHIAINTAPDLFAREVLAFLGA
jgi:pimeloyl-ACP methyl ester carboxylesterase